MRFAHKYSGITILFLGLALTLASGCGTPSVTSNQPIVLPPEYSGNLSTVYGAASPINLRANPATSSDFKWRDSTGILHSLSELRGKIVLLNFWATWCSNCIPELPELESISNEMRADSVVVIGVLTDPNLTFSVLQYNLKVQHVTYQNIADPETLIYSNYDQISAIPQTFLIDRNGVIQQFFAGAQSKQQFVDAINAIP